jgi:hypothetical protein
MQYCTRSNNFVNIFSRVVEKPIHKNRIFGCGGFFYSVNSIWLRFYAGFLEARSVKKTNTYSIIYVPSVFGCRNYKDIMECA